MGEHRTDLIVSAKTEGFQELQQQILDTQERVAESNRRITDELTKTRRASEQQQGQPGAKSMDALRADAQRLAADMAKADPAQLVEKYDALKSKLTGLYREQEALNELMLALPDKAVPEYQQLTDEMKSLEKAAQGVARQVQLLDRAHGDQMRRHRQEQQRARREAEEEERAARGSLTQGFLQGAMPFPAAFLQRGPGMRRQMLGMMFGGAVGGLAGGAFTGLGGLQQGLTALGLGHAAGALGTAAGWSQQGLALEQQQLGMMPFLGGGQGYLGGVAAARGGLISGAGTVRRLKDAEDAEIARITPAMIEASAKELYRQEVRDVATAGEPGARAARAGHALARGGRAAMSLATEAADQLIFGAVEREKKEIAESNRMTRGRIREASDRPFAGIIGAGERFGYGAQESMQTAMQVLMAGGGTGEDLKSSGLGTGMFALQRAFGVQAPTAGAFMMAGRRGGLAGGGDAKGVVDTIAGAMKLGLEGTEIIEHLQTVAAGIESFKTTGIPFARQSIEEMGGALAKVGITGPRGLRMAGALATAAQNIGMTGVQTPLQLSLLKNLGGFEGGFEGYFDAAVRMEQGQFKPGGMDALFRERMRMGGGGKRGAAFLSGELQSLGIRLNLGDAATMARVYEGQETPEDLKRMSEIQEQIGKVAKGTPSSMADVERRAGGFVGAAGTNVKEHVRIQNEQIATGRKYLGQMIQLEASTAKTVTQFMRLVGEGEGGGILGDYADAMTSLTKGIKGAVDWFKSMGAAPAMGSTP